MAKSTSGLLAQIEDGALDSRTPLADVLRQCVALGGRAGSEKLRDWARRELDGYADGEDQLPKYRIIPAAIAVDGANIRWQFTGHQISTMELPEFARDVIKAEAPLPHCVAELEGMVASGETIKLQHPGMPGLVSYMNSKADYGTAIHAMYWKVTRASIQGVLDTIRTTLVSLVAEMRAVGVEEMPTAEAADQAVNVVLHNAKRSTITVNTNQTSGANGGPQSILQSASPEKRSRIPAWIRGPWGFAIGASTIIAGVAGAAVWLGWTPFG
jgi:hypothetical protein